MATRGAFGTEPVIPTRGGKVTPFQATVLANRLEYSRRFSDLVEAEGIRIALGDHDRRMEATVPAGRFNIFTGLARHQKERIIQIRRTQEEVLAERPAVREAHLDERRQILAGELGLTGQV